MEIFDQIAQVGLASVTLLLASFSELIRMPVDPKTRLYWLYAISSLATALVLYVLIRRKQRLSGQDEQVGLRNFFRFCFPRSIWNHPSARLDMRFFAVHLTVQGAILPIFRIGYVSSIALAIQSWIMGRYGTPPLWEYRESYLAAVACTIFAIMLLDFLSYAMHVMQHKVPFLWEFHKVHHSVAVLNPLSNFREHPIDNIFYQWVIGLSNGVAAGVLLSLFDELRGITILGIAFLTFAFNFAAYHLRHSHLWLAWPPALGKVLGSPANHQLHHSAEARHIDKNFGFIFALWDWIFGTLYLPRERETFRVGLRDGTESQYTSFLRLYFLPFINISRSILSRFRRLSG